VKGHLEILAGVLLLGLSCLIAGFVLGVANGPIVRARRRRWTNDRARRPGVMNTRTPW
jgi:hypothetical protein